MKKVKWIGIIATVALMTGCSMGAPMSYDGMTMEPQATVVNVLEVKVDTLKEQFPLPTVLHTDNIETVKAKMSLDPKLLVSVGETVEANQKLLDIDMGYLSSEVKALELELSTLKLSLKEKESELKTFVKTGKSEKIADLDHQLNSAKLNYDNQAKTVEINEVLYEQGNLSEKDYLQGKISLTTFEQSYLAAKKAKDSFVTTGYDLAKAQLEKSIEELKFSISTKTDQVTEKEKSVAEYRMTSPIAGMVVSVWNESDNIGEIKVADHMGLKGEFLVSKGMKQYLNVGDAIDISYEGDTRTKGIIESIAIVPNDAAGQYKVTVFVDNNNEAIALGEFVYIYVDLVVASDVMVVPANAVIKGTLEDHVFVVENGMAVKKVVKTGLKDNDMIEIKEGLTLEDLVVVTGQYTLSEGAMVQLVDDQANTDN